MYVEIYVTNTRTYFPTHTQAYQHKHSILCVSRLHIYIHSERNQENNSKRLPSSWPRARKSDRTSNTQKTHTHTTEERLRSDFRWFGCAPFSRYTYTRKLYNIHVAFCALARRTNTQSMVRPKTNQFN